MAIELGIPAVAGSAYFAVAGRTVSLVACVLGGYAVLMALVQVRLIPVYRRLSFTPGFWSFAFAYAAAAADALVWLAIKKPPAATGYAIAVIALLTAFVAWIAFRTVVLAGTVAARLLHFLLYRQALLTGRAWMARGFRATQAIAMTTAVTTAGTTGAYGCAWLSIQSPRKAPAATPTMVAVRRRAEGAVSDQVARPLNRSMKVAVKAVVEMPGTWSERMAFACSPIANAASGHQDVGETGGRSGRDPDSEEGGLQDQRDGERDRHPARPHLEDWLSSVS